MFFKPSIVDRVRLNAANDFDGKPILRRRIGEVAGGEKSIAGHKHGENERQDVTQQRRRHRRRRAIVLDQNRPSAQLRFHLQLQ